MSKATRLVDAGEAIVVLDPPPRFVSRAGDKLDGALTHLALDVTGLRALDAGASTGGFTDCLLQRGAAEVVAVDVGYGLLHERLLADPRVRNVDRTNIRALDLDAVGGAFDLVTGDLSFISLRSVAPVLVGAARPGTSLVLLAKPQFEATKLEADRGRGVITDPAVWRRVLIEVIAAFSSVGASIMEVMVSTVLGPDGNVEFVLHLQRRAPSAPPDRPDPSIDQLVDQLVDVAVTRARALGGR